MCQFDASSQRGSVSIGPSSAHKKAITCIISPAFRRSGSGSLSPAGAAGATLVWISTS